MRHGKKCSRISTSSTIGLRVRNNEFVNDKIDRRCPCYSVGEVFGSDSRHVDNLKLYLHALACREIMFLARWGLADGTVGLSTAPYSVRQTAQENVRPSTITASSQYTNDQTESFLLLWNEARSSNNGGCSLSSFRAQQHGRGFRGFYWKYEAHYQQRSPY